MRYLITGGCGFIGYNLSTRLAALGHQVVVIDNLSRAGAWRNQGNFSLYGNVKFLHQDIRSDLNSSDFLSALEETDAVFHLAGQVAVTKSIENPENDYSNNVEGTFKVLEAIRKSKKRPGIIFSSTNKVYGDLENCHVVDLGKRYQFAGTTKAVSESQPLDFHSPYGCSKGAADQYVRDYGRIYGLRTVVFRQSCIYGEHQYGIEDQGWVAWMAIAALLGKKIVVYGDGKQVRDLLHVEDLFNAFYSASQNFEKVSGQVFNMGGGINNTLSVLELLSVLEEQLQMKIDYSFQDQRQGDQKIYVSNTDKIQGALGWTPQIDIEKGIRRLISWIKENLNEIQQSLELK